MSNQNKTSQKVTALQEEGSGIFRNPPANYDAERALLGSILIDNISFEKVSNFLKAEHFADPNHGHIFEALTKVIQRGQIGDPLTLKNYFESKDTLESIGGASYLAKLAEEAVLTSSAGEYGRIIHDLYKRRRLVSLGHDIMNQSYDSNLEENASNLIEQAEQNLYELATSGDYEGDLQSFDKSLTSAIKIAEAAYKRDGKLTGVSTALLDLDKQLGGLHPSDLIIIAGRPSMGKTAIATNIAFAAAKSYKAAIAQDGSESAEDGAITAFFSLEMSSEQLATRILAEQGKISSEKIRRGEISNNDFQNIVQASQDLATIPLFIDDTPALTISNIRTRARRLKRTKGLGLIVIDYLQLISPSGGSRADGRVQEVSEITRGLKAIAKELSVPVLALSQLSRKVEDREDKRPQLADLRESGSIEQDADVVMFIFREEYYLVRLEPTAGTDKHLEWQQDMEKVHNLAELIVAKQRHGPIGKVFATFDPSSTKFSDHVKNDNLPITE